MAENKAKVFRLIQYEGDPEWIKNTISKSIQDFMDCGDGNKVSVLHLYRYDVYGGKMKAIMQEKKDVCDITKYVNIEIEED